jgi:hypothetical protein
VSTTAHRVAVVLCLGAVPSLSCVRDTSPRPPQALLKLQAESLAPPGAAVPVTEIDHAGAKRKALITSARFRLHVPKPIDPEVLAGLVADLARV